jgi:hypothetical protein
MDHVGPSSCQKAYNNIPKNIRVKTKACSRSSTNFESTKSYGMEPLDFLELLLRKNLWNLMKKLVCFKIHRLVVFHGQKLSLGMMVWFLKFDALFAANFQENQSCWFLNFICYIRTLVIKRQLYLVWVWLLVTSTTTTMLHTTRMKGHSLGGILILLWL